MGEASKVEKKGLWSQIWVYGVIVIAVFVLIFYIVKPIDVTLLLEPSGVPIAEFTGELILITLSALAALVFLLVARQFKWFETKTGQIAFLITLGFLLWTIAEAVFFGYELMGIEPFPSIADGFYIAGYVPFAIALILNIRTVKMKFKPLTLAIWIVASVAIFLALLFVEFIPFLMEGITLDSLSLIYPLEDFILLVLVLVIVLKFRSGEIAKPWGLLVAGFILDAIGDTWYTYISWYESELPAYNLYDLFFIFSYLAMFASGLYFIWLYKGR
jgi:hypothetical protein